MIDLYPYVLYYIIMRTGNVMNTLRNTIGRSRACIGFLAAAAMLATAPVFAFHPLITDDSGTQGKGKFELEFAFQHDHDNYYWLDTAPQSYVDDFLELNSVTGRRHTRDDMNQVSFGVTYGIVDNLDVAIGIPYQHVRSKERRNFIDGNFQFLYLKTSSIASGLSDVNVELKWKFFEYNQLSLALKPGIFFPVGDEDKGLGSGRVRPYGYFITTVATDYVIMHLNLGYIRNQNRLNEREDIWHGSLAIEFVLVKDYLKLVTNGGLERNPSRRSNIHDIFVLGGFVVSPTPNCDIDAGFKYGVAPKGTESPGADYSILAGFTVRF